MIQKGTTMKKYLFVWLIPVLWSASSLLSLNWPGDEYGLYAVSSLAGTWIVFLVKPGGSPHDMAFWLPITVCGILVMSICGFVLSLLKASLKVWIPVYLLSAVALCVLAVCSYPSFEKAMSKNGSLWAYIFSSMNIGLYVSVIFTAIISGILKMIKPKQTEALTN